LQALISDNQVRIATSGEERNRLLRDVPTAKESGFRIHRDQLERSPRGLGCRRAHSQSAHRSALSISPQATASTLGMDARGNAPGMRDRMAGMSSGRR
jgi:hypothetical protein